MYPIELSVAENDISAFVLAGGKSRRMGCDKAQIPWNNVEQNATLLSHAIDRLRSVTSRVFVVGEVEIGDAAVEVLPDLIPGNGPLGGIHTALSSTETPWNIVLGVDLPLISAAFLHFMAGICRLERHKKVIVPRINDGFQPLSAAYHRDFLPVCAAAMARKQLSIHDLFRNTPTRIMEEDEIRDAGYPAESFLNVNTPADLARAESLAGR
jgi:molybdopterin-guanine dinucleotide biosynthesis protein A